MELKWRLVWQALQSGWGSAKVGRAVALGVATQLADIKVERASSGLRVVYRYTVLSQTVPRFRSNPLSFTKDLGKRVVRLLKAVLPLPHT